MPSDITEVWAKRPSEGTRRYLPPEGETLQVRRVPKGKLKQFLIFVYFRLKILTLFDCSQRNLEINVT